MCQAFASGYERVVCVAEVEDARALAGDGVALAGERHNVLIEGFDFGNSPREFLDAPSHSTLVMTTTNGTRLLLAAAARCDTVLVASLLNLGAVVEAARASGAESVAVLCAGVDGAFAIDDAYVAGRIAQALGGEPDDAALAAVAARRLVRDRRGRHRRRHQRPEHPRREPRRGHRVLRSRERARPRSAHRRPPRRRRRDRARLAPPAAALVPPAAISIDASRGWLDFSFFD